MPTGRKSPRRRRQFPERKRFWLRAADPPRPFVRHTRRTSRGANFQQTRTRAPRLKMNQGGAPQTPSSEHMLIHLEGRRAETSAAATSRFPVRGVRGIRTKHLGPRCTIAASWPHLRKEEFGRSHCGRHAFVGRVSRRSEAAPLSRNWRSGRPSALYRREPYVEKNEQEAPSAASELKL